MIITQPEMKGPLSVYLYRIQPPGQRSLYRPVGPEEQNRDWQLRPYVPLSMYVQFDLWEGYSAKVPAEP